MLNIGERAPDFALPDDAGHTVTLSSLLEAGPVVLYFYPADFTPVCTSQACMFRDWTAELAAAGVRVVGISAQSSQSKHRFKEKYSLGFTLLADEKKEAIRAYGAQFLLGLFTRRVTYLVERREGVAVIADRAVADLRVGAHLEFVKRVLRRAQSAAPPGSLA